MPQSPSVSSSRVPHQTAFSASNWLLSFHRHNRLNCHYHCVNIKNQASRPCVVPRKYCIKASYGNNTPQSRDGEQSPDDIIPSIDSEEYFKRLRALIDSEQILSNPLGLKKSFEIVRFDEDGIGPRDRYVYVEERDCIGCTHCATTAPGTFFMEADHGRARVYDQMGECEAAIEEAIDTCPVNCIYYVDWVDLVNLENMREGQAINNWTRLVGGQDHLSSRKGEKATTVMDSGIMRCNDCPGMGCPQCPMYGVGQNPEFIRKKAAREEKARNRKFRDSRKDKRRRL